MSLRCLSFLQHAVWHTLPKLQKYAAGYEQIVVSTCLSIFSGNTKRAKESLTMYDSGEDEVRLGGELGAVAVLDSPLQFLPGLDLPSNPIKIPPMLIIRQKN